MKDSKAQNPALVPTTFGGKAELYPDITNNHSYPSGNITLNPGGNSSRKPKGARSAGVYNPGGRSDGYHSENTFSSLRLFSPQMKILNNSITSPSFPHIKQTYHQQWLIALVSTLALIGNLYIIYTYKVQRLNNYALPLCITKDIHFEMRVANHIQDLDVSVEKRKVIYLFPQQAINNCLKYASARNLLIRFIKNRQVLYVSIKDNGIGFTANRSYHGNGLNNMKQRSKEINGLIEFKP